MKSAVTEMRTTTGAAVTSLNSSADILYAATRDFALAGQEVVSTLDKSAAVAVQLVKAADNVSVASAGLGSMFADYQTARDSMIMQVKSLHLLADQVRRDASMSGEVLEKIGAATEKLVAAQRDADDYLSKISDVIGVAHQSFSEGMTRAVGEANREFHQALSDSVRLLREGIHELESTLDAATSI
jgi:ABC-type transporter Mla subunit MlaD